jgi:molybdate/tungstate transport system substrate-binding protein
VFLKKSKRAYLVALVVIVAAIAGITSYVLPGHSKTELRVLCAGSLMVPFNEMEKEFEAQHPEVDVLIEGHGSIQVIRHVTELYEESDVLVVADYSLIPMMMYSTKIPDTTESYADWHVKFATNTMGIAYTPQSKYADEIDTENWYEILARPDIKLGFSDARLDSCGYRALMVCQLASLYYNDETMFEGITGGFSPPVTVSENASEYVISVPELLNPVKATLRPSSVRLLALLDSGDIDYAFMYRSMAEQYGLRFLELPPEINLGSEGYSELTEGLKVILAFQRFASIQPEFDCQPIVYGITIPSNAPHPEMAIEFASFVIGTEGQRILSDNYQPSIVPAETDNLDGLPDALKPLVATQACS